MRERAALCRYAGLYEATAGRHTTFNDDRTCDACRHRLAAHDLPRAGASVPEGSPQPSGTSSRGGGAPPAAAPVSDLSATHGTARAQVGSGGERVQCDNPHEPTSVGPAHLSRRLRRFGWSPYRDRLAALARL